MEPLVAKPPLRLMGPPKGEPSIENCTVPLGVPAPGATALTAAVKITLCPKTEGLDEELTEVMVAARFTVCVRVCELAELKPESPLYTALKE